ncbi:hypothetical protein G6H54_002860 [Listeria monocytogenes]|nr:hypothetical protein [Listeria monocytogenes]EEO7554400.1 hypothetical protein [Listeria monocytogenes]EEO9090074.1 hypothetical protein [Listeria monocytogenes]MBC1742042.1 hypothetical protein [Listeria welshimeri]
MKRFLVKNYLFLIFINLVSSVAMIYPSIFGIISIFMLVLIITIIFQGKAITKINKPEIFVYKPQNLLMYMTAIFFTVVGIGGTIFLYPYLNAWLKISTGYLEVIYHLKNILILVGLILYVLAYTATILKIQTINYQFMMVNGKKT